MEEFLNRLDLIERRIPEVKNKVARRDLLKMLKTIDSALVDVDKESVECRRLHRQTPKHHELVKRADDLISNLEKHLTFAVLLSG